MTTESTSPRHHTTSSLPRLDRDRAVIEQAKGALMLRYGISSHEAFALLLTWSRDSGTTLHTLADTLVNGIRQGDETGRHEPTLIRWLQRQLHADLSGNW